ncbi:MAG: hypothetical protein COV29_00355 [Candidatus Yanofskybacteria bacterium CG10_big_fil_rev_8_21_14_0_10_36_16]|uniref:Uncharacterized protein n=1 Tax=Candidatus Yanofskybacteria bacterium CG10_big_fil_rev_8_21_14_0_10_36_16 TaxID=1975096 RepID=A0A2J0Q8N6_9BACT|nr:MAG: hypothetical protein COV29_00355 [Candidatus Yanofskybacteria bacterium CG10_big_fil_rev_8_21_14_0_10_36_16]
MSEEFEKDYTREPSPEYQKGNQLLREVAERIVELKKLVQDNPEITEQLQGTAEYLLSESSKETDAKTPAETIETRERQRPISQEMLDILSRLES